MDRHLPTARAARNDRVRVKGRKRKEDFDSDINPASIDMTGVGAYAAYLMGLEFIDEQSPV